MVNSQYIETVKHTLVGNKCSPQEEWSEFKWWWGWGVGET